MNYVEITQGHCGLCLAVDGRDTAVGYTAPRAVFRVASAAGRAVVAQLCYDCAEDLEAAQPSSAQTAIYNDNDCERCTASARPLTCRDCRRWAFIVDCEHMPQPRPIAYRHGESEGALCLDCYQTPF